jgi:O-acetylhomoserine (thiol)-lyase
MNEHWKFDTLKVRAGYDAHDHGLANAVPIYQTASFELDGVERAQRLNTFQEAGHVYSRLTNPTVQVLEKRIAALDHGMAALAVGSGMAAVSYSLLNIAEGGGEILVTPNLYGGTFNSFKKIYPKFGVHIGIIDTPSGPESIERQIGSDTRAIFLESISNPDAELYDVDAIAQVAHRHGIPLVVDNTIATPYLFNPLDHGADIVVYSLTKGISGHGNAIGGMIVEGGRFNWGNGRFPQFSELDYNLKDKDGHSRSILDVFPDSPFVARVRSIYINFFGSTLSPFNAYLTLLGLDTLSERLRKQVSSAEQVVQYLEAHPRVEWVHHPSSSSSPFRDLANRNFPRGSGAVLAFGFKGTRQERDRFLNAAQLFGYQANIGDVHSLIINVADTTHREYTPEERERAGFSSNTIRLSIGLEDAEDLIADLDQAFTHALEQNEELSTQPVSAEPSLA